MKIQPSCIATLFLLLAPFAAQASEGDDIAAVAALDTQYQAAVKANDAAGMAKILADDFILVIGNGSVSTNNQRHAKGRPELHKTYGWTDGTT